MTQRRSIIPMLGVILYLAIVIGAATDGKPGMLIATIVALVLIFFLRILRSKMHDKREIALPTEEETLFSTAQQQSHIQLLSIFIPISIIVGAISGDITVLITIVVLIVIFFAYFLLKKRSPAQQAIYRQEKKILLGYTVAGFILAALIFVFDLAK